MKLALLTNLLLAATTSLIPYASAEAADLYGAIYYSNSGAYGYAYNYTTEQIADAVAFKACSNYANDCYLAVWTVNGCAALARANNNGAGWAWANSGDSAKVAALTNCSSRGTNCQVVAAFCTGSKTLNLAPQENEQDYVNGFELGAADNLSRSLRANDLQEADFEGGRVGAQANQSSK